MCIYTRTVFECKHHLWGRRLKLCTIGEDFRAGELSSDCVFRKPHGLHSRRVARRCDRCGALDRKLALTRAKLEECRRAFRELRPWYGGAEEKGQGAGLRRETTVGAGMESLHAYVDGTEMKVLDRTEDLAGPTLKSPNRGGTTKQIAEHDQGHTTI